MTSEENKKTKKDYSLELSVFASAVVISVAWIYTSGLKQENKPLANEPDNSALEEQVLPKDGYTLPIAWRNLGKKLVEIGAIDDKSFRSIYSEASVLPDEFEILLSGNNPDKLKITGDNSGFLLNLFWALGLANKNPILENGEMTNPNYGGAGNFASTGGWTVAKGNSMDHYSRYPLVVLTPKQQEMVEKISKGIYRPCCDNSTHFPDCNHGMAMLGLLELMAYQNVSEKEMWRTALAVNSYWFPGNYITIAAYMKERGVDWKGVNPEEVLGKNYSSASGYAKIASQITAPKRQTGGSCGV